MKIGRSLAVVSALLLAVGVAASFSVKDHLKVEINDTGYSPALIEAKVGETVVWTNVSRGEHTVTSTDMIAYDSLESNGVEKPLFDSGPIKAGGTYERLFDTAGTYKYSCHMQETMKGTVIVRKAE